MKRLHTLLCALVLALAGCAGPAQRAETPVADTLAPAAQQRAGSGDFQGAAQVYLTAAATEQEPQRTTLQLRGGYYLARGGLWRQLESLLAGIDLNRLGADQQSGYRLLAAELALSRRQPDQALNLLGAITRPASLPDQGQYFYRLRAEASAMAGNDFEAARARVRLDQLLRDPSQRLDNQYRIWELLSGLSTPALEQRQSSAQSEAMSGWIELVLIGRTTRGDRQQWDRALAGWRTRYPGHPAEAALLPDISRQVTRAGERPGHIAVLLPLSGRAAESASAIRDGILAAYYGGAAERPELRFYDTGEDSTLVPALYQHVVQDGAEFVIGPLLKQEVEKLAATRELPVSILALNQVDEQQEPPALHETQPPPQQSALPVPAQAGRESGDPAAAPAGTSSPPAARDGHAGSLYQFGLAPEDEARQAAERLFDQGLSHVVALVPQTPWGERVVSAFSEHLTALGGRLLAVGQYQPDTADFKEPIQQVFNLDASKNRHRALENRLGQKLHYEARRRQDVDAVFVLGFPEQVRLIRPQLRFHHAGNLPVFSTSHVYVATASPALDRDLDGLYFCDMPWVLDDYGDWAARRKQVSTLWPQRSQRYQRLFALGVDAYDLIPELGTLGLPGFGAFPGATGQLSLDQRDMVHRKLEWAQFRGGIPHKLADPSTLSTEGQHEPQSQGRPR